jgi:DNA-3-methyladenine glycosylase II
VNSRIRKAERHLKRVDPTLADVMQRHGPCTLMLDPRPHFHTLVWAIINQQLSVKAAQAIEARLQVRLDTGIFQPGHFYRVHAHTLRSCGLSAAKIRYVREIVRRLRAGELDLQQLEILDDEHASELLMDLPVFSMGRMDVLPVGDLALRKSIRLHYRLPVDAGHEVYRELAEIWRPYRSIASWYYWAAVD